MARNNYHFVTHWRVESTAMEICEIMADAAELPRWWPSVYLDVQVFEEGDEHGVGKVVSLYTKGWLPYTLCWQFRVTESRYPYGSTLEAWGDLVGRGIWTFAEDGRFVDITYDWKIQADKPLLRYGSLLLKPILGANHLWAMRQGEISLKLELARRRAVTPAAMDLVPPPPGPTFVRQTR